MFFAAKVVTAIAYDECGKINGTICLIAAAAATETPLGKQINK